MSRISGLPDELLVKILTFLPTKAAVSTSILSKQWEFLWMWLPKLEYDSTDYTEESAFGEIIDKNLPLHRAPVIESLRLDISDHINPDDIKRWIEIAVSRHVRELEISHYSDNQNIFPSRLFTCLSLVILKLEYMTLMDVPSTVCLPSLKTLQLDVTYEGRESLQRLLSICPVLEDLSVHFAGEIADGEMGQFTIIVPSLQRLSLSIEDYWRLERYVIDTPSLKYFKLEDHNGSEHYCEIKNMPMLKEAYVHVVFFVLKSVIGSIKSVKRLMICSKGDAVYGGGFVFNQLQHLKICVCKNNWSNLLAQLLKDSPNLRVLDISYKEHHRTEDLLNPMVSWNQPSTVPECLLSSLQIFKWSRYFGRPQDRDIAVYILKNACHLSTATILADTIEFDVSNLKMIKELTLSSRASTTCELMFVEDSDVEDYET